MGKMTDERRATIAAHLEQHGMLPEEYAQELLAAFDALTLERDAVRREVLEDRVAKEVESTQKLQAEWGPSYDMKVSQATRAARHHGGQALIDWLNTTGNGSVPELVRAWASVGAAMAREAIGRDKGFSITPEEARPPPSPALSVLGQTTPARIAQPKEAITTADRP